MSASRHVLAAGSYVAGMARLRMTMVVALVTLAVFGIGLAPPAGADGAAGWWERVEADVDAAIGMVSPGEVAEYQAP